MKRPIFNLFAALFLALLAKACTSAVAESQSVAEPEDLVSMVHPLMGTDSEFSLSNGNTYPAIALPWGMNFWTPMTNKMGDGWTYQYDAYKIRGFKQTHQPSPWINDYAAFSLMPLTGKLVFEESERESWFSHKTETVRPDYYKVYLADYDIVTEITPTERAAQFRFTFPETDSAWILLDGFFKGSMVQVLPEERKIIGYCRNNSGGVPDNFHNYFVAEFDTDFTVSHTWTDEWTLQPNTARAEGEHVGAIIGFATERGEQVTVRVASSFISPEQAQLNLDREIGEDSFDQTQQKAQNTWNAELGRIELKGGQERDRETFYSCLYRLLLFPRTFYEIDANEEIVHYSPYNGEVLPGYMYTDNGFWDTFRAVFPFFNLMYPELNGQIMQGLENAYKESGWLPEWASPGHRDCMIGSNSAPIIADAYLKGVDGFDAELLLEAMVKNATVEEGRPVQSVGRAGVDYYNELGYVPYDVGINENAARTLEYAYADFTVAEMARAMGKDDVADRFYEQAQNYRNLYDTASGWMRGKNEDGNFQAPFNPLKWGDAFTEGNSLHYTWSVFHDVAGLMDLMGGDQAFAKKLDEVFTMPPRFDNSYYGFTIHEIREMQIVNMGNYAHGNQPIQHMIYLYNYAGQPWKSQARAREVMEKLYHPGPDGYCGDEDNGQTSAWFVFSAMGFYPVCPGTDQYVLGSPLFEEMTLHLENGNSVRIEAPDNSQKNIYVDRVRLDGRDWENTWIDYESLQNGAILRFYMSDEPNEQRGTGQANRPYSWSIHAAKSNDNG